MSALQDTPENEYTMPRQKPLQILGAFMFLDGFSLLTFDGAYVCLWCRGAATNPYRRAMDWLAERPPWLLRAAGVAEAGLGLALFRQAREARADRAIP